VICLCPCGYALHGTSIRYRCPPTSLCGR